MNKSFLKWAGGKSKLLDILLPEIGKVEGNYIEPFAGSSVVSFNVDAERCVLADICDDLINVFRQLKLYGEVFIRYSSLLFEEEFKNEDSYYKFRTRFNNTSNDLEKAVLFVYLNRNSFNGLCRYNQSGKFNTPFGSYKKVYFPEKELSWFYKNCQNYKFKVSNFQDLLLKTNKKDVIYADPPYVPLSDTSYFTAYSPTVFGIKEQEQLVCIAKKSKSRFIISNSDTEFTRQLYKDADKIIEVEVNRSISAKATSRAKAKELIVIYGEK